MLFQMCHNNIQGSFVQWCWPDGKSGLDQKQYVIEFFKIMYNEAQKQLNKKMDQANNG